MCSHFSGLCCSKPRDMSADKLCTCHSLAPGPRPCWPLLPPPKLRSIFLSRSLLLLLCLSLHRHFLIARNQLQRQHQRILKVHTPEHQHTHALKHLCCTKLKLQTTSFDAQQFANYQTRQIFATTVRPSLSLLPTLSLSLYSHALFCLFVRSNLVAHTFGPV